MGSRARLLALVALAAMLATAAPLAQGRGLSQYNPMTDPLWPNRHANANPSNATKMGQWSMGRITAAYNHDGMDLDKAACAFGDIQPEQWNGQGLQVAAMSDVNPAYTSSCGRCYELKCRNANFKDAYGNELDRPNNCANNQGSIVVKIVDSCPCNYPSNQYSNGRWCCGDMTHFDVSYWAFQRMASPSIGVIAVNWRQVPCTYVPPHNLGPVKTPPGWPTSTQYDAPYGSQDRGFPASSDVTFPGTASSNSSTAPSPSSSSPAPSSSSSQSPPSSSSSSPPSDGQWQSSSPPPPPPQSSRCLAEADSAASSPGSSSVHQIYDGGLQHSWHNASWWTVRDFTKGASPPLSCSLPFADLALDAECRLDVQPACTSDGPSGSAGACCAELETGGAIAFQSDGGLFNGTSTLQFQARGSGLSKIDVHLAAATTVEWGPCRAVSLKDQTPTGHGAGGWAAYSVPLAAFTTELNFEGCGGATLQQMNKLAFVNPTKAPVTLCIDTVALSS